MSDGKPGIIGSLWRFITFWKLRKALGLIRAGDAQFTGSTQGISDAFDLHHDALVKQYKDLLAAVSEVESIGEENRLRLETLNKEEEDLIAKRDGALTKFEAAQAAGNEAEVAKHKAAFERFHTRIEQIEAEQAQIEATLKELEASTASHMRNLTAMQAEIKRLPVEKANEMAKFVSNKALIDLNERLNGLKSSIDRGPIDAVRAANNQLAAKARVSQKIAGADVDQQDAEYAAAGAKDRASDAMTAMLAARKAGKDAQSGEKPDDAKRVEV